MKFENIRYDTRTGLVTVFDYGLASFHLKDFKAVYEKQLHERGDDQFRRQDPVFNQLMLKTNCGSPCYAAPEIYDGCNYWGPEVDIWSLGVILYGLVVGGLPFFGDTFNQLRDKVKSAQVYYPPYLSNGKLQ